MIKSCIVHVSRNLVLSEVGITKYCCFVCRDLGFSEVGIRAPDQTKPFLFISPKQIVGLFDTK
jgi:hypothetical protein